MSRRFAGAGQFRRGARSAPIRRASTDTDQLSPLLVFHFDEAASGTGPTDAINSGSLGTGSNMPITYESNLSYTETAEGRGLEFATAEAGGRLTRAATAAERSAISGSTSLLLEYLFDHASAFAVSEVYGTHCVGIEMGGGSINFLGLKTIVEASQVRAHIQWFAGAADNTVRFVLADDGETLTGKIMLQAVIDTANATEADRVRLYALEDGGSWARVPMLAGTMPAQDATIDTIADGRHLVIGSHRTENANTDGILHFASLHNELTDATELEQRAVALMADSDGGA